MRLGDAAADHERARAREIPQGLEGALGLVFLIERDPDDEKDRREKRDGFLGIAEEEIDPCRWR